MLLDGKLCVTKRISNQFRPKIQLLKIELCHRGGRGGVGKVPKMCYILFEWPLTTYCIKSDTLSILSSSNKLDSFQPMSCQSRLKISLVSIFAKL
jgi:hypothetical protein